MPEKLFLAFVGATYYNATPGDLIGSRHTKEEAMELGAAKHKKDLETWGSSDYCWYCVIEINLTTLQHTTVFDSR